MIDPESSLEDSGDVFEVIPDALESTLEVTPTLPEATLEVSLTRDEFMAKFGIIADANTSENRAYTQACAEVGEKGFWLVPDGTMWTKD